MVEIPWDATSVYGDPSKGQVEVELINMGMIEYQHGWGLYEKVKVLQGSGGTEWVAVYFDEYIVRFTALKVNVFYSEEKPPSIKAIVHPIYCEGSSETCEITFELPS
tara:strand:- start:8736 stop:9056 length:321 start_codon:yes stop_codon:yes gene_type:complete